MNKLYKKYIKTELLDVYKRQEQNEVDAILSSSWDVRRCGCWLSSPGLWFTVIKTGIFWLEKGTFYRGRGPEIFQYPRFGPFYENSTAGTVAIVPFFQKNFKKRARLTQ